jgi:hypothetical protein
MLHARGERLEAAFGRRPYPDIAVQNEGKIFVENNRPTTANLFQNKT